MSDPDTARAYRTLDGLRGVAALIVVTRHVDHFFAAGLFPESFLAVDLFFLLSGFVVAHAYEARLLAGRPLGGFLKTRLIRLYPLYALGLGLGLLAKLAGGGANPRWLLQAVAIGLLMLPAVPPLPMGSSALNGPTWTLLPELLVNLLYAATLRWLKGAALFVIIALGAIGLVASEIAYGTLDGGWSVDRFPLIGARLAFSFFLGVAMFRSRPARRTGPIAAAAALALTGAALMLSPEGLARRLYELFAVLVLFPAAVSVAVRREPGRRSAPVFHTLGVASYAVYVLHKPFGALAALALKRAPVFARPSLLSAAVFLAAVVALALAADALYDRPVRRWLSRRSPHPPHGGRRAEMEASAVVGVG